jgi:ribose transport system substrate-binding protein
VLANACTSLRVGVGGAAEANPTTTSEASALPLVGSPSRSASIPPIADATGPPGGTPPASDPRVVGSQPAFAPRIGYISLDGDLAYVGSVSSGIRTSVAAAGFELVECDPDWTREGVLACAERLGAIGIDALLSFQPFADLAAQVCELTGHVPTFGIVFAQGPCEVSGLRVDQAEAGRLAGEHVGRFAERRWRCEVSAFVSLESSDADPEGRARMEGYRSGYEEHCRLPGRSPVLDGADRLITAQAAMADLLERLRGRRILVVGINEDAILGAMAAAEEAGRAGDLWFSGQLADPVIRGHIACDRRYLASVAQFPERFGEQLVPLVLQALDGHAVPPVVEAPLALVTADNVRELFPDTTPCEG